MFIYFDFEYRKNNNPDEVILLSYLVSDEQNAHTIDLRNNSGRVELSRLVQKYNKLIWVAYNAIADLSCLVAFGIDISGLEVIDLMAEARMITLTNKDYFSHSSSLLSSLEALNIDACDTSAICKDLTREIILENKNYSTEQWIKIKTYGPTDVLPLKDLISHVWDIHVNAGHHISLKDMLQRGEYIKSLTMLNTRTKGFPINVVLFEQIFENKQAIYNYFQDLAIAKYGNVYTNKGNHGMRFSYKAFDKWLTDNCIQWDKTPTGWPILQKEYFKKKVQSHPELNELYEIRKTLQALNTKDLRDKVYDGHIKPDLFPFAQKTSRNSYKPTSGYLLNLTHWMRTLIRPKEGCLFIGIDWSQQEIAIAAALSGDPKYLEIYNSKDGDVYLGLAKLAGSVPDHATKDSHPLMRDIFKTIQLGLGYGKGLNSLAEDIYWLHVNNEGQKKISKTEAYDLAYEIYHWHKKTFYVYWEWIAETITIARTNGFYRSLDGWTYFIDSTTKDTQLLNLPMQSNGAAMLRKAVINCCKSGDIDVVCTLHDAIYITCSDTQSEKAISDVINCMDKACQELLNNKIKVRTDVSVYDHKLGYTSEKGKALLDLVKKAIGDINLAA
ncbi:MAG: DNA polymerase [Colwellia sp.]|nr:DNA polymerase [Colwellia sp.]